MADKNFQTPSLTSFMFVLAWTTKYIDFESRLHKEGAAVYVDVH